LDEVEAVVIGAGVVGLAIARDLTLTGREVLILEAENRIGSATSSRNSGVIHAGIYYKKDSLKARFCVEGRKALYRYAQERHIPFKACGKLIVATNEEQVAMLHGIQARAKMNGVNDLTELSSNDVRKLEPHVKSLEGLFSPSTGIIDVHQLMHSYLGDAENNGATLALNSPVIAVKAESGRFDVSVGGASPTTLACRFLVNAAGLNAQKIAKNTTGLSPTTIPERYMAKGNYFSLNGPQPFSHLVYPVPEPGGLGVHATLDLAGRIRFGPDVEWTDTINYRVDQSRGERFYQAIRRYWPDLPDGALQADFAGIRPKISTPDEPDADFAIQGAKTHGINGLVSLYGIESPGLTSALALANHQSRIINY
jgi:L-2-hydroxyglutarate oxidase LhgO